MLKGRSRKAPFSIVCAFVLALAACGGASEGVGEGGRPAPHFKPGFNLFSPEQDVELGRQSAQQIAREAPLLDDAATVNYVRQLGARLAAKAPGHNFPYQFNVVATREINAFALPGGFIFVNAGTIAAAKNEGELAGVISHEISHVALRHGTNQASKAYIAQAGLGVLGALAGGDSPELGEIINTIGGAGANMLFLKFGRTAETQADLEGARIMASAGYDPRDMAGFFETLQKQSGGQRIPEMLSDHPDPGNRVAAINELLPSLQMSRTPVRDSPEFQQIKARLTGRGAGAGGAALRSSNEPERRGPQNPDDIEPGARPNAPSSSTKTFQAGDGTFAFSYPDNWDGLALRGGESNLVFAPRGGYGEIDGAVYVTHGIFIGTVDPSAPDLERANSAYVEQQIQANPDFRVHRAPEAVQFGDGRRGYATVVTGPSTVTGVVEVDVIYTTATRDGRLFYLITMAPEDEFPRYQPAFEQIIKSLRLAQ
ncbi:MAG TPA: M48 family metalloprotease [Pyrinomonadaceae bacterium]|nr:M48 family metalloprotease [Pyrinomonadaceae bacterium]